MDAIGAAELARQRGETGLLGALAGDGQVPVRIERQ
jgi:hypothetical protein